MFLDRCLSDGRFGTTRELYLKLLKNRMEALKLAKNKYFTFLSLSSYAKLLNILLWRNCEWDGRLKYHCRQFGAL